MDSLRSNQMCTLMTGTPTSFSNLEKYGMSAHRVGTSFFTTSTAKQTVDVNSESNIVSLGQNIECPNCN